MTIQPATCQARGFTLLEVLIALAILAISSLAVITQTSQSLSQQQQLQAKTAATIVAENQLVALQVSPRWPALGTQRQSINQDGWEWQVQTRISTTTDPWLRKIEVSVFSNVAGNEVMIADLIGYRGLH